MNVDPACWYSDSIEQNPTWKADSHLASREIHVEGPYPELGEYSPNPHVPFLDPF
jgi:hypothetical protein